MTSQKSTKTKTKKVKIDLEVIEEVDVAMILGINRSSTELQTSAS